MDAEGEVCDICEELQDTQNYEDVNICTRCFDVMEDIMADYFIRFVEPQEDKGRLYVKYIEDDSKHVMSDRLHIMEKVPQHLRTLEKKIRFDLEKETVESKKQYYEWALKVLNWLKDNQWFYKYYFKHLYKCPSCGASLFKDFNSEIKGDWMIISCGVCGEIIKKYYLPEIF